jgi:hypothetical protein
MGYRCALDIARHPAPGVTGEDEAAFADFKKDYATPNGCHDIGEVYYWACKWHEAYRALAMNTPPDQMLADIVKAKEALIKIKDRARCRSSAKVSDDVCDMAAKALAALEKYGESK